MYNEMLLESGNKANENEKKELKVEFLKKLK